MTMKLIIDTPYLCHRSYLAPFRDRLTTSKGQDATMFYTFFRSFLKLMREQQPSKVQCAFESHGTDSWRRKILPTYKPEKPVKHDYIDQMKDVQNVLYNLGIEMYHSKGNEADDVIAWLVDYDIPTRIFTVDKDLFQLVNDKTPVEILCKGKIYKEQDVVDKFGVKPDKIPLFLAIVGDASDNILGVRGIGSKKASRMINNNTYGKDLNAEQKRIAKRNLRITQLHYFDKPEQLIPERTWSNQEILDKYEIKDLNLKMNFQRRLI